MTRSRRSGSQTSDSESERLSVDSVGSDDRSGEYRIFGPPGTGKTTTLIRQVSRAADRFGPDDVVVCSFTKAAATEFAFRDERLPKRNVGTLHSFAYRAIGRPPVAESKASEWNSHFVGYRLSAGLRVDEDGIQGGDAPGDKLLADAQLCRAKMIPRPWPSVLVERFFSAWESWMDQTGYVDYTRMIELALDTVFMAEDPKVGFFDEAQDFTPLELSLVRHWGSRMKYIVLAGDDDQTIYSFTGASPKAFLFPPIEDDRKIFLRQSYRIPKGVHSISQKWISRVQEREKKEFKPREREEPKQEDDPRLRPINESVATIRNGDFRSVDGIVDLAEELIEKTEGDVMILGTCSFLLYDTIREMKSRGLPFWNPYRVKRGDWNPLNAIKVARSYLSAMNGGDWKWSDFNRWIGYVDSKFLARGTKRQVKAFADEDTDDERFAPWQFVSDCFESDVQYWNGGDLSVLQKISLDSKKSVLDYPIRVQQTRGRDSVTKDPRIVIGTIHSVKGAQANSVIMFPEYSSRSEDEDALRRVFYVGMTRSIDRLLFASPHGSVPFVDFETLRV